MKKRRNMLLAAALALLLCACAAPGDGDGTLYSVYYRTDTAQARGAAAVASADIRAEGEDSEEIAAALLEAMLGSGGEGLESPLPEGTQVLGVTIADGEAVVDLSQQYSRLSGVDLTIADACITLTLSQLPEVERISVLSQGQALSYRDQQSLSEEELLLSRMDDEERTLRARLYFLDAESGELAAETRTLTLAEGQTRAEAVLSALLEGPESEALLPLLDEEVQVLSVRMDEEVCYVSLSAEFWETVPEDSQAQENVIYSIVRSLCALSDVQAVQLSAESGAALYGQIDISAPLRG